MPLSMALILEFESRSGEIVNLFAKCKKTINQLLETPIVGRRNSTPVSEESTELF